jgi:hypothetical protein
MQREFLNWDVETHRHRLVVPAGGHDRDALYGAIRQFSSVPYCTSCGKGKSSLDACIQSAKTRMASF